MPGTNLRYHRRQDQSSFPSGRCRLDHLYNATGEHAKAAYICVRTTCTLATFLVHLKDDGSGYLHLIDIQPEPHIIQVKTKKNYRKEIQFKHTDHAQELFYFTW